MEQPNKSYIKNLSGGDAAFEDKLIAIIKMEFPEEKKTYFLNLENKNFEKVAQNVHKLKHKISILGLEESYNIASNFEEQLLQGDTSLSREFETILSVIETYLKKI